MGKLGIDDVDDLSGVTLLAKDREVLFAQQSECTFIFNRSGGWPSGVVMSFVYHEECLWIASIVNRPQVACLAEDPRVTVVVSNAGTQTPARQMIAVRGVAVIHEPGSETFENMFEIICICFICFFNDFIMTFRFFRDLRFSIFSNSS